MTIYGTLTTGIILTNPTTQDPLTIGTTGYVTNSGTAIYGPGSVAWALTNLGTITANGAAVLLVAGTVTNGSPFAPGALISGADNGVAITGAPGAIANSGTIAGSGPIYTNGVVLGEGGTVTNNFGGVIEGSDRGIWLRPGPSGGGTVNNLGTIAALGSLVTLGTAIALGGGVVENGRSGLITAYNRGIFGGALGGDTTVINYGTIDVYEQNVFLPPAMAIQSMPRGTVANFGTISGRGLNGGVGIQLQHGGIVLNGSKGAPALIEAYGHAVGTAPDIDSTVVNYGVLQTTEPGVKPRDSGAVLMFHGGGTIVNYGLMTGVLDGVWTAINDTHGGVGTVTNSGTISEGWGFVPPYGAPRGLYPRAVYLGGGGTVVNGQGGVSSAVIDAGWNGIAVYNSAGNVLNLGTVASHATTFSVSGAPAAGVILGDGGTLVNGANNQTSALIQAYESPVYIGGDEAVPVAGAIGTAINFGTIAGVGTTGVARSTIKLVSGGAVVNYGLISSVGSTGIGFYGTAGSVTNTGTIASSAPTGAGVYLQEGGTVGNEAGGLVTAFYGIAIGAADGTTTAAATLTNAGTISGDIGVAISAADTSADTIVNSGVITGTSGTAIRLGSGDDAVVIEAGSKINGAIDNLHPGDTIDLPFITFASGGTVRLDPGNVLHISEGSQTYDINFDPTQDFSGDIFSTASDGKGGTLISDVSRPRLLFFGSGSGLDQVNLVLTPDGGNPPPPVAGKSNIEIFTSISGALAAGFDGAALVPGGGLVSDSVVQAGTLDRPEELLAGSYGVVDESGHQSLEIVGAAKGGSSVTVAGSTGDTITGSTVAGNAQLIDASGANPQVNAGPMTISGGAGNTTVWSGVGDSVTGAAGAMTVDGSPGGSTISSGAGALAAAGATVSGAAGDTITGGAGSNYLTAGVRDSIIGGSGNTTVAGNLGSADTISGASGAMTVIGSATDLIEGGTGALQVNDALHAGAQTIKGGAGNLHVFDIGKHDSITGSTSGTTLIDDNYGSGGASTISGGSGSLTGAGGLSVNTEIVGGAGDTISGGSGTAYIDGIAGSQSITGGAAAATVQAGNGDTVGAGSGALQVYLDSNQATTTVNLGAGHGAASLRDVSIAGAAGGAISVSGFASGGDVIQSKTSVSASGAFLGTSKSDGSGGTILTFLDGTTMTLAGVADASKITFAQ